MPLPSADLKAVDSVLVSMASACDLAIAEFFFGVRDEPREQSRVVDLVSVKMKHG
jgi:hypothetical protein